MKRQREKERRIETPSEEAGRILNDPVAFSERISQGNLHFLRLLEVRQHDEVLRKTHDNVLLLHYLLFQGHFELVDFLYSRTRASEQHTLGSYLIETVRRNGVSLGQYIKNTHTFAPLLQALKTQREDLFPLLQYQGACRTKDGWMILHDLAETGSQEEVRKLLSFPAVDVNATACKGALSSLTALHVAVLSARFGIVEELLKKLGININAKSSEKRTALHYAAKGGHTEILFRLLQSPHSDINDQAEPGETVLYHAIGRGKLPVVVELLKNININVNLKDSSSLTILQRIAMTIDTRVALYLPVLKELLKHPGLCMNEKNAGGETPLQVAVRYNRVGVAQALCDSREAAFNEKGNDGSPLLHRALRSGYKEMVLALIQLVRMEMNATDNEGNTVLHLAVLRNEELLVRKLLTHADIKVNEINDQGFTPLHIAVEQDLSCLGQLLLLHPKIEVNKAGRDGLTPLALAVNTGKVNAIDYLLRANGIRCDVLNNEGLSLLHMAVKQGLGVTEALLRLSFPMDVNLKDREGFTPLHRAIKLRMLPVFLRLLKEPRVDVNLKDQEGFTPLLLALQEEWYEGVQALWLQKRHLIKDGKTEESCCMLLVLAAKKGQGQIVSDLLRIPEFRVKGVDEEIAKVCNAVLELSIQLGQIDIVRKLFLKMGVAIAGRVVTMQDCRGLCQLIVQYSELSKNGLLEEAGLIRAIFVGKFLDVEQIKVMKKSQLFSIVDSFSEGMRACLFPPTATYPRH